MIERTLAALYVPQNTLVSGLSPTNFWSYVLPISAFVNAISIESMG
jgi:hypothetical protein